MALDSTCDITWKKNHDTSLGFEAVTYNVGYKNGCPVPVC